jgi:hypothetical protein
MMGLRSEEFKEMETYVEYNMQGRKLDPRCEINKAVTSLFSYTDYSDLFLLYVMMCINFRIIVRVMQNNERGLPLIFAITEV